jgi:hypothetical protein
MSIRVVLADQRLALGVDTLFLQEAFAVLTVGHDAAVGAGLVSFVACAVAGPEADKQRNGGHYYHYQLGAGNDYSHTVSIACRYSSRYGKMLLVKVENYGIIMHYQELTMPAPIRERVWYQPPKPTMEPYEDNGSPSLWPLFDYRRHAEMLRSKTLDEITLQDYEAEQQIAREKGEDTLTAMGGWVISVFYNDPEAHGPARFVAQKLKVISETIVAFDVNGEMIDVDPSTDRIVHLPLARFPDLAVTPDQAAA